jgi:hypothetical protein
MKKKKHFFSEKFLTNLTPYVHFRRSFSVVLFYTRFLIHCYRNLKMVKNRKISWRTHKFNPSIIKGPDRLDNPERLNTLKFFSVFFNKKTLYSGIIVTK